MSVPDEVLRIYPGPAECMRAEQVYGDLVFPRLGGGRGGPYVAINMVSTLDGKVSIGGKASPIGSGIDRRIMRNIRCAVDAVLVGAGTARAEEMDLGVPDWLSKKREARGLPAQPLGVVLAGAGRLPLERKIFGGSGGRRVAVIAGGTTPENTLEEASKLGVDVLRAEGADLPDPPKALNLLRERLGVGSVLLEGGPAVNGAFIASGLVDDLFLTLSPKISLSQDGAPSLATPPEPRPKNNATAGFELRSVHSSPREGELYLRYRLSPPSTGFR